MIFRRASVCLFAFAALAAHAPSAEEPAPKAAAPATPAAPIVPTVIESGTAEMVSTEKETTFTFGNGVTVTGTNLRMTCEHLEVIARRTGDSAATFGKQENFKSLVATGNVRMVQNDREATCERAEVFPGDNKVVLSGNPRVRSLDGQYEASGPQMELLRGERRARIIGTATERPRLTLPALKDLGYEKEKKKEPEKTPAAPGSPPASTAPITVPIPPPK